MSKPTKAQRSVLQAIVDGWELGGSEHGAVVRFSVQQGGQGKGGDSISVHANTVHALQDRDWITLRTRKFPVRYYAITTHGQRALCPLCLGTKKVPGAIMTGPRLMQSTKPCEDCK